MTIYQTRKEHSLGAGNLILSARRNFRIRRPFFRIRIDKATKCILILNSTTGKIVFSTKISSLISNTSGHSLKICSWICLNSLLVIRINLDYSRKVQLLFRTTVWVTITKTQIINTRYKEATLNTTSKKECLISLMVALPRLFWLRNSNNFSKSLCISWTA